MSNDLSLEQLEFHQKNRQRLLELLPENSAVVVFSGEECIRNRDVEFPFRAESDFIYLTGFEEPNAVLVLLKSQTEVSYIFVRDKDPEQEIWQGRCLGVAEASNVLKLDCSEDIEHLDEKMPRLFEDIESVYVSFSHTSGICVRVYDWIAELKAKVRKGVSAPKAVCDLDVYLHEMRVIKSDFEIQCLRKAAAISVQGHLAAMKSALSSHFEFQIQAALEAEFLRLGAARVAFNSIVASGEQACILHYTDNRSEIDQTGLVLVDAGAEWQGYAGDITTTFPASGTFSSEQAQLYTLVLSAQSAAIEVIAPGVSYDAPHQAAVRVLAQGLLDLGLLQGDLETVIEKEEYKHFFMHGTGHWLGMDVHDVGEYKQKKCWRKFEPGMVITVEPGLYIADAHQEIDAQWRGIGIRIEDDVLVTESGCEVLTTGLPRTVDEIETWMRQDQQVV